MKIYWKPLIICLLIPLAGGGLSAFFSKSGEVYATFQKPPLSPPGWVFPVVWSLLFLLMGIASYLVYTSPGDRAKISCALVVYAVQLAIALIWPIPFFRMRLYLFSFFLLLTLWVMILVTLVLFCRISRKAGYLLIPYLVWVTFAGYLNLGVYLLNGVKK